MSETTISADIAIAAPPERVWAVLADLPGYQAWNPVWREASGELAPGKRLTIISTPADTDHSMTIKVKVVTADPPAELRWRSSVLGLSSSEHRFVLTPEADGTRLVQSHVYRGLFSRFAPKTVDRIRSSFVAINQGIKEQAERH
jgi:hypothetical protein